MSCCSPVPLQKRALVLDPNRLAQLGVTQGPSVAPAAVQGAGALGPAQQVLVRAADTFLIASASGAAPTAGSSGGDGGIGSSGGSRSSSGGGGNTGGGGRGGAVGPGHFQPSPSAYGCDISHRGGAPGFVQVWLPALA